MKTLETTRFGQIEYSEEEIIVFEKGIPGFEQEQEFIVVKMDNEDQLNPLAFLQSIKTAELSFIIANPFSFYADYEFDLDEATKEELEINEANNIAVWGIISVPEEFEKAVNLAIDGCRKIYDLQKEALKMKYLAIKQQEEVEE